MYVDIGRTSGRSITVFWGIISFVAAAKQLIDCVCTVRGRIINYVLGSVVRLVNIHKHIGLGRAIEVVATENGAVVKGCLAKESGRGCAIRTTNYDIHFAKNLGFHIGMVRTKRFLVAQTATVGVAVNGAVVNMDSGGIVRVSIDIAKGRTAIEVAVKIQVWPKLISTLPATVVGWP